MRGGTPRTPSGLVSCYIPAAGRVAEWLAKQTGGIPQSGITESALNIPTTAHVLGGAVIGADPEPGVIDTRNRAFGYSNGAGKGGFPTDRRPELPQAARPAGASAEVSS